MIRLLMSLALALLASGSVAQAQATDPQNTLVIETSKGRIQIKLRPDLAPKHVAQVKQLAKQGFYDGIIFHRVIAGFMAQTGDPTGTGTGGSKLRIYRQNSARSRSSVAASAQRGPAIPIAPIASSSSASAMAADS